MWLMGGVGIAKKGGRRSVQGEEECIAPSIIADCLRSVNPGFAGGAYGAWCEGRPKENELIVHRLRCHGAIPGWPSAIPARAVCRL
jgi:hypothetical protein